MKIDENSLKAFRKEFKAAVEALEKKHGVTIELGNIKFNESSFHSKIEVKNFDAPTDEEKEAKYLDQYCRLFEGFPKRGHQFVANGMHFELIGMSRKPCKYPMFARNLVDGKTYKLPMEMVQPRSKPSQKLF